MGRSAWLLAATLTLAGCGDGAGAPAAAPGGRFDALDACRTVDRSVVAAAMRVPVVRAELGDVAPGKPDSTHSSTCTYTLADGRRLQVVARRFPGAANTPGQLAEARRQLTGGGAMRVVPGVGRLALYAASMNQLSVYVGASDHLDVIVPPDLVTGPVRAGDPALEAAAIAIARRVSG